MMRLPVLLTLALFATSAFAQEPQLAPNAPEDKPGSVMADQMAAFEAAIAPHVAQARSTYPDAKARFLAGLPRGQSFFVTTRVYDATGNFEQVFVAVQGVEGEIISGKIWSEIRGVKGYKFGDSHRFPESAMLDWLITYPDGSEEGNFVGKFLDSLR